MNQKDKARIRAEDRLWFNQQMWDFMEGKEIHHDWENGCFCFVLTKEEHLKRTRQEIRIRFTPVGSCAWLHDIHNFLKNT